MKLVNFSLSFMKIVLLFIYCFIGFNNDDDRSITEGAFILAILTLMA